MLRSGSKIPYLEILIFIEVPREVLQFLVDRVVLFYRELAGGILETVYAMG